MKAQLKKAAVISALMMCSSTAFAIGPDEQKPATRIDFNKIIDENNNSKDDIQQSMQTQLTQEPELNDADEQQNVSDFLDVEIGTKSDRPVVVDRRFNSVGTPRVASEVELKLIFKGRSGS